MQKKRIQLLEQTLGIRVLKARIIGRRWSNEGGVPRDLPLGPPHRIQVTESTGYIVYGWHELDLEQTSEVIKTLESEYVDN
ncbi:MAG: hypothetical protein ACLFVQ_06745 [Chitinispirillaceae bacterium]